MAKTDTMNLPSLVEQFLTSPEYLALVARCRAYFLVKPQMGLIPDHAIVAIWRTADHDTRVKVYVQTAAEGPQHIVPLLLHGQGAVHRVAQRFADFLNQQVPNTVYGGYDNQGNPTPVEESSYVWPRDHEDPLVVGRQQVCDHLMATLQDAPEVHAAAQHILTEFQVAYQSGRMDEVHRQGRLSALIPALHEAVFDGLTDKQILTGVQKVLASERKSWEAKQGDSLYAKERAQAIQKLREGSIVPPQA